MRVQQDGAIVPPVAGLGRAMRMDRLVNYFSSTEADERNAYTSHMNIEPPYVVEIQKYGKFLVRAVHAF